MQCTNNLKQIGLAVHNFHATYNALPPSSLGPNRVALLGLLYPYIEQPVLQDIIVETTNHAVAETDPRRTGDGLLGNVSGYWWWCRKTENCSGGGYSGLPGGENLGLLTDGQREAIASVNAYICPSSGRTATYNVAHAYSGPLSDYAFLSTTGFTDDNMTVYASGTSATWRDYTRATTFGMGDNEGPALRGPFGIPEITLRSNSSNNATHGGYSTSWTPADNFGRWIDGTSNQIILGEKHHSKWNPMSKGGSVSQTNTIALLGTSGTGNESGITYEQYGMYGGDYSYLCAAAGNAYNPNKNARTFDNPLGCIAPGPKADLQNLDDTSQLVSGAVETDYNDELFGSSHTGVSNFLLGDGSVHPVSVTSPTDVLRKLGDISDGHAVTLP